MRAQNWLWLLMVLVLVVCGETTGDLPGVNVDLTVTPDPPQVGPATVVVTFHDAKGEPITGAEVKLEGTMTHAGMVPVFAQATEVDPGRYEATLEFTMGGDWVIIVRATMPDGHSLERQFDVPGVRVS